MVLLPYEITLFSNFARCWSVSAVVLLPYEITLFSNCKSNNCVYPYVLLPYEITLFSNCTNIFLKKRKFCYLMKLHYSQTDITPTMIRRWFCYLMKLHYSQTVVSVNRTTAQFCYLMKLHYSQTSNKLRHYQHRVISYQLYDIKKSHFCQSRINPYLLSLYLP